MTSPSQNKASVLIIGGGLAGLAAATALAPAGFRVTILESRNRLGGRASSFSDPSTGQLIDNCQHVSMGCCTNLAHFWRTIGIDHLVRPEPRLYFMTPDRRVSSFAADPLPAPFHLLRSFISNHYLTLAEKARIAWGLLCLQRGVRDDDPPFADWLARHRQTPRTIARFWGLVLTSALNESPDRIGLRYARKVFVDGFLRHRRGFEVQIPTVPLGRLYGEELCRWFEKNEVSVGLNTGVKAIRIHEGRAAEIDLRPEKAVTADWYIAAIPFERLLDVLPAELIDQEPCFGNLRKLEHSPITSVHLWFDRPILSQPHVVLVDGVGQWVFNRGEADGDGHYVQVVVSAARQFRGLGREEVERLVVEELKGVFLAATAAVVRRARVITEHAATFSAVPGVDEWRPGQESPIPNLFLAGDWTATGWPATMEGAVRSGYLAAEALCRRVGVNCEFVQPDL
jgi:squalene-associated FAD-dependent desaturase